MKTTNSKHAFSDRYRKLMLLGEGSYGKVYKARDIDGNIVAIKKISLDAFGCDEGVPYTSLREISILKSLKHKNIVKLLNVEYQVDNRKIYLVFEFVDEDLKKHIVSHLNLSQLDEIKDILKQILTGLEYMFIKGFMHRDLKPHNILISSEKVVKLADFGLSRHFNFPHNDHSKEIQTLWYRSPEVMLGDKDYGISLDMWSVGCIFAEMLDKRVLFKGDSQIDMIFRIFQTLGTPTHETYPGVNKLPDWMFTFPQFQATGLKNLYPMLPDDALDLLSKFVVINPNKRISPIEALRHPFFTNSHK